jgi:2-methylcitrate dehydratase PrpD
VRDALELVGEGASCTIVGQSRRSSPYGAALANGAASHVLDFDDVNVAMIGHPAVVVIPAALALAEHEHTDGRALLAGVVAGYQVASDLGRAVNPSHYERGWHATATLGCIAAAAAAARVAGLGEEQTARALSLGATQAGGVQAMFGSHGKGFHAGRAAGAGMLAAGLARAGADVPSDVLEAQAGYFAVAADASRSPEQPFRTDPPAILATAFKGHAACGGTHCLIDAVAAIIREQQLDPASIQSIHARVHQLAIRAAGLDAPTTGLEAKFSLRHLAALAAYHYPLLPDVFEGDRFTSERVVALRDRVTLEIDESMAYEEAMPADVTIVTTDSRTFRRRVDVPRGRPGNPMTDEELGRKFSALAAPILGSAGAQRALEILWRLAEAPDVAETARALAR